MQPQVTVLGATIDRVTLDEAVQAIAGFVASGRPHQVVTVNLDFLRLGREDARFCEIINRSALAVADGMPLVWASRWLGAALPERVTGVALVERCCALAAQAGYRIFLLGSAPGVAAAAGTALMARYPGLQIAGNYAPPMGPFSAAENEAMVARIRAARPHLLFVAFGAPKQETWIAEHLVDLDVPVVVGIGGVFNFLTGRVRRAPRWMQESGLEWLYRVIQEPRRLWRRYFVEDLPVLVQVAAGALHARVLGRVRRVATASLRPLTDGAHRAVAPVAFPGLLDPPP